MNIGERLKEAREKKGLMKIEVANMVGVTNTAIYAFEKGIRVPSAVTLAELAKVLECSTDYLCGLERRSNIGQGIRHRQEGRRVTWSEKYIT